MISDALIFLKNHLNAALSLGGSPDESREDRVVFLDGEKIDPLTFPLGAVSALLINIEEENRLRPPDLYRRTAANGATQQVQPEVRLNFYVLFVAHFKQYEDSLRALSQIIQYFQNHRLLNHQNAPELSEDIDHLVLELITLPFGEQNEVWSALRTTYRPSVLYKVKMVIFQDQDAVTAPAITERQLRTSL